MIVTTMMATKMLIMFVVSYTLVQAKASAAAAVRVAAVEKPAAVGQAAIKSSTGH